MKRLAILLSAAFVLLASAPAFAQGSFNVGFLNSIDVVKSGNSSSTNPLSGFYAGFGYTLPLTSTLNFTPGVYYGYAANSSATDLIITTLSGKRQDHLINIPLHLSFGLDVNPNFRFYAYAGPSLSFGLASIITGSLGKNSSSYDRYQEDSNLNRFDIMLGGGLGVEILDNFRINVGYDFGMLNRYNNSNTIYHRNQLTAGVAYVF